MRRRSSAFLRVSTLSPRRMAAAVGVPPNTPPDIFPPGTSPDPGLPRRDRDLYPPGGGDLPDTDLPQRDNPDLVPLHFPPDQSPPDINVPEPGRTV